MHVDHHVGVLQTHPGALPLAEAVAEPVGNGVLDAVSDEARVGELVAVSHRVDGESALGGHQRTPVELLGALVELIGVLCGEFMNGLEDTQSCTAAHVGAVEHLEVPLERHHSAPRLHILGTEAAQLLGQHIFQSLEGLGHHFKIFFHLQLCNICAKVRIFRLTDKDRPLRSDGRTGGMRRLCPPLDFFC